MELDERLRWIEIRVTSSLKPRAEELKHLFTNEKSRWGLWQLLYIDLRSSVLRVTHIAYQLEQQQVVITLDETRFIGLIFQFLVWVKEILKSKLCLTSEKLLAWSVVRSLSELTMIVIDEETFSSETVVLLYDV